MEKSKVNQKAADRRQLEQEIHLVQAPKSLLAKEREEKLKVAVEEDKMQE
jgi:hypothetical protein